MVTKFRKSKKESFQTIFFSTLLGVLVLLLIGFLIVSSWRVSQKRIELNSRIHALKDQIQALEKEKQELQARISQGAGESYLEKEARERFNLKKPGEEVVSILPFEEEKEGTSEKKEGAWWNIFSW